MIRTLTPNGIQWQHYSMPSAEEISALLRQLQLSPSHAHALTRADHRPEILLGTDYIVFLVTIPVFNKKLRTTSGAVFAAVVRGEALTTVHYQPIPVIDSLLDQFTSSGEHASSPAPSNPLSLWLAMLSHMLIGSFHKLERLAKHIDIVEEAVFRGNERKMVEEISILGRDTMDFRKIIRQERTLFATQPSHPLTPSPVADEWHSIHQQFEKIWEALENSAESIDHLAATNVTLLQHKENELLRLLAIFSALAIPAWMLVIPFTPSSTSQLWEHLLYWGILLLLSLVLGTILLRFKNKRVL